MSVQIYNEGRVAGFSAYEIYLKEHAAVDPNTEPASEREWLASSLASGSSMVLEVRGDADSSAANWTCLEPELVYEVNGTLIYDLSPYIYETILPETSIFGDAIDTSKLCAANNIIASLFIGKPYNNEIPETEGTWAGTIESYGQLICNTETTHPPVDTPAGISANIPIGGETQWTGQFGAEHIADEEKEAKVLKNYTLIQDGILYQPGTWTARTASEGGDAPHPYCTFTPNLSEPPKIRILFRHKLAQDEKIYILLTGFTDRTVVSGVSGIDGVTYNAETGLAENWENGGFLGPAEFPWSTKIIFSVPSDFIPTFYDSFDRIIFQNTFKTDTPLIPGIGVTAQKIGSPAIDMPENPYNYYSAFPEGSFINSSAIPIMVLRSIPYGDSMNCLTVGRPTLTSYNFPPALYATRTNTVTVTNDQSEAVARLCPVAAVAPGSICAFRDADALTLRQYEVVYPGTVAININNTDGTISILNPDTVQEDDPEFLPTASVTQQDLVYTSRISSDTQAQGVLTETGNLKGFSIAAGTISEDGTVSQYILSNDSSTVLTPTSSNITWTDLAESLANNKSIDILGANMKAVKAGLPGNYIQFPNGLRLYISATAPPTTGVPVGSIGIGW